MVLMGEILVIQHSAPETLGGIADALDTHQLRPHYIQAFAEEVPRELGIASGLILLGGPMGVYEDDRFPFLRDEMRLIEAALAAGKPILGVCLGSQLLAATLGAEVKRGKLKEIGWHQVQLSPDGRRDDLFRELPEQFMAFHWHGDVFSLPSGAAPLASSGMTAQQAFRYGSAYGLLFHLEVTLALVNAMTECFAEEAATAGADITAIRLAADSYLPALTRIGATIFDRWARLTY
jgi:GMP synthase (glutamine-hydrolysing)